MLVSCLTGYYTREFVEMRPRNVVLHYLKTWGLLDLGLVVSDWTGVAMTITDQGDQKQAWMSFGKVFKYYRFLRVLRMFRLVKLLGKLGSYFEALSSEVTAVLGRLLGLVVFILTINHYIACLWCAIGRYNDADEMTWIKAAHLEDAKESYMYAVALHWAMTQFTPATNNVAPTNMGERIFAFLVVLFALIVFSSFLGSLTQAISQLKKIHINRFSEEGEIRRFIFERQVSMLCARRVWKFYRTVQRSEDADVLCMDEVGFFGKLPRLLRMALYEDISIPVLKEHWALYYLNHASHDSCLLVCEAALSEVGLRPQQEIFNNGSIAECMIILRSGSVSYYSETSASFSSLNAPQLICEVALWGNWLHCGSLNTITSCHSMSLDAKAFAELIRSSADQHVFRCICKYAHSFVSRMNEADDGFKVADIVDPSDAPLFGHYCHDIARDAFGPLAPSRTSRFSMISAKVGTVTHYGTGTWSEESGGVHALSSMSNSWRRRTGVVIGRLMSLRSPH